jgi:hypothetical protein
MRKLILSLIILSTFSISFATCLTQDEIDAITNISNMANTSPSILINLFQRLCYVDSNLTNNLISDISSVNNSLNSYINTTNQNIQTINTNIINLSNQDVILRGLIDNNFNYTNTYFYTKTEMDILFNNFRNNSLNDTKNYLTNYTSWFEQNFDVLATLKQVTQMFNVTSQFNNLSNQFDSFRSITEEKFSTYVRKDEFNSTILNLTDTINNWIRYEELHKPSILDYWWLSIPIIAVLYFFYKKQGKMPTFPTQVTPKEEEISQRLEELAKPKQEYAYDIQKERIKKKDIDKRKQEWLQKRKEIMEEEKKEELRPIA